MAAEDLRDEIVESSLEARLSSDDSSECETPVAPHVANATPTPISNKAQPNTLLDSALAFAKRGWSVFPLHHVTAAGSCSCGKPGCSSPGKHPRLNDGFKVATVDAGKIAQWWRVWPNANVGLRTGAESGLVVIDLDADDAIDTLKSVGELPTTLSVKTGRGRHLYFKHPGAGRVALRVRVFEGVDVRADGGYVVAPPSLHVNGTRYEFEDAAEAVAEIPHWLLSAIGDRKTGSSKIIGRIPEGQRNDRLTSIGGALVRQGISGDPLTQMLGVANATVCDPPLPDEEARTVAKSVERYGSLRLFKFHSVGDLFDMPSPEWRVEGLLPEGAFSMVFAPPGNYKTFFGLDLALCVASGHAFHGRQVKQGPVVYVMGEGSGGVRNRVLAWMRRHALKDVPDAFFVLEAVQFRRPDDLGGLRHQLKSLNCDPAMLLIDTFARTAVGVDENDATEVGEWIDAVTSLQQELKVDVVVFHHTTKVGPGKSPSKAQVRGSSAIMGAVDTAIRLAKDSAGVKVSCEKQKEGEPFKPFTLGVETVALGADEKREEQTSCVLVDEDSPRTLPGTVGRKILRAVQALGGSAKRRDLLVDFEMSERTFDREAKSLIEAGQLELDAPGTFTLTEAGLSAIPVMRFEVADDIRSQVDVATPHPPKGGGVATRVANESGDLTQTLQEVLRSSAQEGER